MHCPHHAGKWSRQPQACSPTLKGCQILQLGKFSGFRGVSSSFKQVTAQAASSAALQAACMVTCTEAKSAPTGMGLQLTGLKICPCPWLAQLPRLCELQQQPCCAGHVSTCVSKVSTSPHAQQSQQGLCTPVIHTISLVWLPHLHAEGVRSAASLASPQQHLGGRNNTTPQEVCFQKPCS